MEQTISTNLAEFPFSKIGGHKKVIEQLRYMIELPFKFSEIKTQKVGLLMYGQPGCGKTLIARELSKALGGCFFIIIQGPELMSQYVGQSEEKLRYAFQECLDQSFERDLPSILFIDEADAVLSKRSTSDTKYEVRFIDQFLTLMDGIYDRGNTIVICATNRPEVIDSAAKRIGRFDKEIQTNPPDSNDRVEIFKIFINEYTESVQISQDINEEFIISFCENLENFNGSDISGIFKEAYEICKRRAFKINKSGQFKKVCDLCRRIFSCHSYLFIKDYDSYLLVIKFILFFVLTQTLDINSIFQLILNSLINFIDSFIFQKIIKSFFLFIQFKTIFILSCLQQSPFIL